MITLTITDETLQASFDKALTGLLEPGNYHNPVKSILENIFSSYSNKDNEIRKQLEEHIKTMIVDTMKSPVFQLSLGQAMATEMAKRELDKLKR